MLQKFWQILLQVYIWRKLKELQCFRSCKVMQLCASYLSFNWSQITSEVVSFLTFTVLMRNIALEKSTTTWFLKHKNSSASSMNITLKNVHFGGFCDKSYHLSLIVLCALSHTTKASHLSLSKETLSLLWFHQPPNVFYVCARCITGTIQSYYTGTLFLIIVDNKCPTFPQFTCIEFRISWWW